MQRSVLRVVQRHCHRSLVRNPFLSNLTKQTWNINKALQSPYSTEDNLNLNIDNTAVTQLKDILKDSQFLRVLVEGGGCSGFQYKFEIDSELDTEEDLIFENDGIKVVSDVESVKILNGATVEYHIDMIRAGFRVVDIPQAEKGCSCGISFSVKL